MRSTIYMLSLLLFFFGGEVLAQSKKYDKAQKNLFLDADSYYVYGDFDTALKLFLQLDGIDKDFNELNYKIGISYWQLDQNSKSIPYLEKGVFYEKEAWYYLAKVKLSTGALVDAKQALVEYKSRWREDSKHNKEDIQFLNKQIATAQQLMANPEKVNIYNLGPKINTAADEYVPLIDGLESKLLFTSKRETDDNGMSPSGKPFEDVYQSTKLEDGTWGQAKRIAGEINTPGNDACAGLSPDGETVFVFRPNENLYAGDLYESKFDGNKWTKPVLLDDHINDFNSIEASASLSIDGKTLFFSSNRKGGMGGFDLYRVKKLPNGEWSWPKNLGPSINTDKNEESPFLHPDGKTLYFSSQGHLNMGGYDVFRSQFVPEDESWSDPVNLGVPTNTTGDDVHFVISSNELRGYYSSQKDDGFGGQDLYQIDYLEKKLRQSVIRGIVLDQDDKPLQADISIIDLATGDLAGVYLSNPRNGNYIFLVNPNVSYEVLIEAPGYEEYIEEMSYQVKDLLMNDQLFKVNLLRNTSN